VQVEPLEDEVQGASRHLPRHLARLNVDDGTVLIVAHMEVRRIVVGQVHRDDDSVEVANLWHNVSFYCSVGAKLSNCFQLLCDYRVKSYESGRNDERSKRKSDALIGFALQGGGRPKAKMHRFCHLRPL